MGFRPSGLGVPNAYTAPYIILVVAQWNTQKIPCGLVPYFLQVLEPNAQRISKLMSAQFCVIALEIRASRTGPKFVGNQLDIA